MSGSKTPESPVTDDSLAFDYVTGVMRGAERVHFEQRLQLQTGLRLRVSFWEEQLMSMSEAPEAIAPGAEVWPAIEQRLQQLSRPVEVQKSPGAWWWRFTSALASVIALVAVSWILLQDPLQSPNADYVAVLTDDTGAPRLTVLTATGGEQMWLKWDNVAVPTDKNLQLWAVSKTDGQIRPLGVFDQTAIQRLALTVPQWRLIKDSSHLLLTEEDVGGSPLDEPSEIVLAKGVCVLLATVTQPI